MKMQNRMKINMIAACDSNRVIGVNSKLAGYSMEDLQRFKALTQDKVVIMGRKTWDSLQSKPLPGRMNVVLSRSAGPRKGLYEEYNNVLWLHNTGNYTDAEDVLIAIMRYLPYHRELFVIGGEEVYADWMHLCDHLYLTRVNTPATYTEKDKVSWFPEPNLPQPFKSLWLTNNAHVDAFIKMPPTKGRSTDFFDCELKTFATPHLANTIVEKGVEEHKKLPEISIPSPETLEYVTLKQKLVEPSQTPTTSCMTKEELEFMMTNQMEDIHNVLAEDIWLDALKLVMNKISAPTLNELIVASATGADTILYEFEERFRVKQTVH